MINAILLVSHNIYHIHTHNNLVDNENFRKVLRIMDSYIDI